VQIKSLKPEDSFWWQTPSGEKLLISSQPVKVSESDALAAKAYGLMEVVGEFSQEVAPEPEPAPAPEPIPEPIPEPEEESPVVEVTSIPQEEEPKLKPGRRINREQ
jgi:hypothetical protein